MSGVQGLRDNDIVKITSGSLLARNTVYNLIGQGAPMLVAFFAIPLLINGLGTERFGVLTLVWMVIGYFGLFDLGMGRALTKLVAEKLGEGEVQEIPALVWTALFLMMLLGLVGTLAVILLSPWLVTTALKIPETLQVETLDAFKLLATSIPVVISIAGLGGILAAQQRFDLINGIRIPMGVFTFLGPLLVLSFSKSLFSVVAVLVAGRLLAWLAHFLFCFYTMPVLRRGIVLQWSMAGLLIRFGGWMTVTNIIGPVMVYLDRFLIGALVSIASVAYYVMPYEVVTKFWLIPGALVGVLFPAFTTSFVQEGNRTVVLFDRGLKYVFLSLFPLSLLIVIFANEGLDLWLGAEFAQNSARVLQWLAVGVFVNSLAQIAFALVQGTGRPDLTAKLHLIELPFYLVTVWWLVSSHGIEGAAIAWTVRVTVDALLLFALVKRVLPGSAAIIRRMSLMVGAAMITLALAALPTEIVIKGFFLLLTLTAFALIAWFLILNPEERMLVQNRLKIVRASIE